MAGCPALESFVLSEAAGCDESLEEELVEEFVSVEEELVEVAGGLGRAFALPGVTVSTAAVLPMLEPPPAPLLGCNPITSVSSPDSLAGVIVGAPLRAAAETSGLVFRTVIVRLMRPGRSACCSFCIRATAVGSAGGTGTPNFTSLFFASPARGESG